MPLTLQLLHILVVLLIETLHVLEDGHFAFPKWGSSILIETGNPAARRARVDTEPPLHITECYGLGRQPCGA